MLYAGCDLHKQTISVCVMNPARQIVKRERLRCADETAIRRFFEGLGEFEVVVEATAKDLKKAAKSAAATIGSTLQMPFSLKTIRGTMFLWAAREPT